MSPRFILKVLLLSLTLNLFGSYLTDKLLPLLFFDTMGTMLSAVLIGPWFAAMVGLLTNAIKGLYATPLSIPFGIVNAAIGLTTGYLVIRMKGYQRWYAPVVVGSATALLAPLLAAPIATWLYGGITSHGIDKFVTALFDSGHSILNSAFWGRIPWSFVDKLVSAYFVFALLKIAFRSTTSSDTSDQQ